MTLLDQVIDGATSDGVSTPNLLRKMLVLARRLESPALLEWANGELSGYDNAKWEAVPSYRGPIPVPVELVFTGPQRSRITHFINEDNVPDKDFRKYHFNVWLVQSVSELEILANGEKDPSQHWSNAAIAQINTWGREGKAFRMEWHEAFSGRRIIPRSVLHSTLDTVRNKALEFALDLQAQYPDAGELNGPSSATNLEVTRTVNYTIHNSIYGNGNTVGSGENVTQNVQVNHNDLEGLLDALKALGLGDAERAEVKNAVEADGGKPGEATKTLLERFQDGSLKVGGAAAGTALVGLLKIALTGFFGVPVP